MNIILKLEKTTPIPKKNLVTWLLDKNIKRQKNLSCVRKIKEISWFERSVLGLGLTVTHFTLSSASIRFGTPENKSKRKPKSIEAFHLTWHNFEKTYQTLSIFSLLPWWNTLCWHGISLKNFLGNTISFQEYIV